MAELPDRAILEHVGRYRVTHRRVLERVFLNGRAPSNVVQRLRDSGFLERIPLKGGISCYQITRKAAGQLSLPPKRSEALTPVSLQNSIAALWFSFLGLRRRHRLEISELEALLGWRPPTGVYCLEREPKPRIYRLYIPGLDTPDETIRRQVEERIGQFIAAADLASWARSRHFALAVLVSEDRRASVNKLLKDLTGSVHILVEAVPHPTTFGDALRKLGEGPEEEGDLFSEPMT